jgi:hypothetical protein
MTRTIDRVRRLLREGGDIRSIESRSPQELIRTLNMLTHDENDIVRQGACRELAEIVSRSSPDRIKDFARRLLWRMNPESGDHPIGAPELFGEIGYRSPHEIEDFVGAFLFYLDDDKLRAGLLQAAGRIGEKLPEALSLHVDGISSYLRHENPLIAGNAALALSRIGATNAEEALKVSEGDTREITLSCGNKLKKLRICDIHEHRSSCTQDPCFIVRTYERSKES